MMRTSVFLLLLAGSFLSLTTVSLATSSSAIARQKLPFSPGQDNPKPPAATNPSEISGMYTFLRDGEFVQLTVEDGQLSGYVSRFGDGSDDKGEFIDQFFDKTSLTGDKLTFNTKVVHGTWYDFSGVVITNSGKQPAQEGYHVMKGTLVQHATDAKGTEKTQQRQVEFKSFPADLSKP